MHLSDCDLSEKEKLTDGEKFDTKCKGKYVTRQCIIAICLNLNCFNFGLGIAWSSPVTVKLTNATQTILKQPLGEEEASWMVSALYLACGIGFITTSLLVDYVGRKRCIVLTCLVKLMSALLFLFASKVWMLVVGRVVTGLSDGILMAVVPVYSSEIASKETRGALGSMFQIFTSLGSLVMLSVGPFISYFYLNLVFTVFILVISMPTVFLPDTPYILYSKGKHQECRKYLIFLRGSHELANKEMAAYETNKDEEKVNLISTFRSKTFLKSLGKSVTVLMSIYLTGFNCVISYLQPILNSTATEIRSDIASVVIGVIQMIACLSTMLTTDRFGRKPILVISSAGMCIGLIGLGTFFHLQHMNVEVTGFLNYLPLISLILIVYCYSAGFGALFWVVVPELFSDRTRGVGFSTVLFIGVVPSFLILRYFTALIAAIGAATTFWSAAAVCVFMGVYICWGIPETRGKTFAEIQGELGGNKK